MSISSGTRQTKLALFSLSTPTLAVSSLGVDSTNLRAFSQVSISDAADRPPIHRGMHASIQDQTASLNFKTCDLDLAKESKKKTSFHLCRSHQRNNLKHNFSYHGSGWNHRYILRHSMRVVLYAHFKCCLHLLHIELGKSRARPLIIQATEVMCVKSCRTIGNDSLA